MGIELDPRPRRSSWPRILAAIVLVLAPIAIAAVLLFGGGQVKGCLGQRGCPSPAEVPGPIPIIGTTAGAMIVVVAVGVLWLVAAGLTIRNLWSTDRARLMQAAVGLPALVVATSVVVALLRLAEGRRLRVVAEDAGLYAVGALIVAVPLVLAWAILTVRDASIGARPTAGS